MGTMKRLAVLAAMLPLFAACGPWEDQWKARRSCEKGQYLIDRADAALAGPSLTADERMQIKSDYFEGILKIRAAQSMDPPACFFYDPKKYRQAATRAAFQMTDHRLKPPPEDP